MFNRGGRSFCEIIRDPNPHATYSTTPTAAQQGTQKLAISQRLKEVLYSKLMLFDTDADDICKEACASKD